MSTVNLSFNVPYQQGAVNLALTPSGPPPSGTFLLKSTTLNLNNAYAGNDYQPNCWSILRDLGINTVDVRGGSQGQVYQWDIDLYPTTWDVNLDNFLKTAQANGIKAMFSMMGDYWGGLFNISCPEPLPNFTGRSFVPSATPDVASAKVRIDKLAGNNNTHINFFQDPRILAWSCANEVDINNPVTRDWVIQITDYMRSKGAKTHVSCPINGNATTGSTTDWMKAISFASTVPLIQGHVDYLDYHDYRIYEVCHAIGSATTPPPNPVDIYQTVYQNFYNDLLGCKNNTGGMPLDHVILGEFGIWTYYDNGSGMSDIGCYVTPEQKAQYYHAVFQACIDVGIKNTANFYTFQQRDGTAYERRYEVVDVGGVYLTPVTNVIKQFYSM